MDYKLVVSDLDGTMFESDLKVNPLNTASIKKLIESGRSFAIATGRPAYSALNVAKQLGINQENMYVICFHGGLIAEASTGRTLYSLPLPWEHALHIIKNARDKNATVIAYIDGLPYTHYDDAEAAAYANQVGVTLTVDSMFEDRVTGECAKVIMRGNPEDLKVIEDTLSEWVNGRVTCVYSSPNLLEYTDPGVSKGRAILMLAETLCVKQEEIIAIGDYFNDLPMLETAGLGVAIKNSPTAVIAAAGYVTKRTAGEGAVSEVIEKLVFSE